MSPRIARSQYILGRTLGRPFREPFGFGRGQPPAAGELLRYRGDSHLITVASTGAGKTAGPVICNLLDHPGQAIVLDVKGAVHKATARAREAMGQKVHVLDLGRGDGRDALNPIDLARHGGGDLSSLSRCLAANLVERTGAERDTFWTNWAETMLTAGISYLLHHKPEDATLAALFDIYHGDDVNYELAVRLDTATDMNRATKAAWAGYLQLSERETRPSVLGCTAEHLRLFGEEMARTVTRETTINLHALVAGDPMTIYITISPAQMAAFRPLLRMWLSGLMDLLMRRETVPEHRTLMIVDEAAQLGKVESFLAAATLMREYSLTLWTIWQSAAQLEVYGSAARTLVDNVGVIQCFGIRNMRMAGEIAALVGSITPEALMAMGKDEQVLLIDGGLPRLAQQVRYYQEDMFCAPIRSCA